MHFPVIRERKMSVRLDFDTKKTAQENIEDFLAHVEATNTDFGRLLRAHLDKMLPLPEASRRSIARAAFNAEIKKRLDDVLAAKKAEHA
jgi:hypothetical protein